MKNVKRCQSCFSCAFKVLHNYGLNSTAFSEVYSTYHFVLTLAVTQVACERSFSKLKLLKSRLRAALTQENLECFMLMSIEKDILEAASYDDIVNRVAQTSNELKDFFYYKRRIHLSCFVGSPVVQMGQILFVFTC